MARTHTASHTGLHAIAITDLVEHRSRLFARIWSVAAVGVFATLAATVGLPHGPDLETWERAAQLGTLGLLTVGVAIAWRQEGFGGSILMVGSVALGVLAALQHQPLVAFLPALAFLLPAVGFLVAWHRTKTFAAVITLATALIMLMVTGGLAAQAMYAHGYGAAHPQSTLPDLPDSAAVWFWSGGVTDTGGVVVARLDSAAEAELVAEDSSGSATRFAGLERGGVWRFDLQGLEPATEYAYSFVVDGTPAPERTGTLRTFATGPMSFSIALGSCARLGSNGAVYEAILETDPDLFLVPGDFFYADHMTTATHFTESYGKTLTQPAQAALLAEVPIAYVWDDHDYGGNDSDRTAPTRDLARNAFSTYVPHYPLTLDTINQAFTIGRARLILLDSRSARDPKTDADGPGKTMLGAAQMEWLQQELLQAQEAHQLIVLVTSVPWIAAAEEGGNPGH